MVKLFRLDRIKKGPPWNANVENKTETDTHVWRAKNFFSDTYNTKKDFVY